MSRYRDTLLRAKAADGGYVFKMAVWRTGSILLLAATTPVLFTQLGVSGYGAYAVITTFTSLLAVSDFGLGNTLQTKLAQAGGRGDEDEERALVSISTRLMTFIALSTACVALLLYSSIDVGRRLGLDNNTQSALLIFMLLYLLGIPLSVASRVQLAKADYGEAAHAAGLSMCLPQVAATCVALQTRDVASTVLATGLTTFVIQTAVALRVFICRHAHLRPSLATKVPRQSYMPLLGNGLPFVLITLAGAISYQTDTLVINSYLGAPAVASYNLTYRYFGVPVMLLAFAVAPQWNKMAGLVGAGEAHLAILAYRKFRRRVLVVSVLVVIGLALSAGPLLKLWSAGAVAPSWPLIATIAVLALLQLNELPVVAVLNAFEVIGRRALLVMGGGVLNLLLSLMLVRRLGLVGPAAASAIVLGAVILLPSIALARALDQPTTEKLEGSR